MVYRCIHRWTLTWKKKIFHYRDVTWASCCFKSQATQLFVSTDGKWCHTFPCHDVVIFTCIGHISSLTPFVQIIGGTVGCTGATYVILMLIKCIEIYRKTLRLFRGKVILHTMSNSDKISCHQNAYFYAFYHQMKAYFENRNTITVIHEIERKGK